MTTIVAVQPMTSLVQTRSLSENPAAVYLASLSKGSRRTMRYSLNTIARKLTGGELDCFTLDWSQVRYQHTTAIRSWLMDKYQPATVNKMLSALRRVLYHAWKLEQMSAEDSERARDIATLRYETISAGRSVSQNELADLLAVCSRDSSPTGLRDAAAISCLYGTGVRRASLVNIDLSDYNQETGDLLVRAAKGQKTLTAHVPSGARLAMADWIKVRGDVPGPLFCRVYKGGKIRPDSRLSTQAVYDLLRRRCGQARVTHMTPHDLRRTLIGDLLSVGVDLATVQQMVGHASPTTTARYDRRKDEIKRKAAAKITVPYIGRLE